jgi:hypothetical protein
MAFIDRLKGFFNPKEEPSREETENSKKLELNFEEIPEKIKNKKSYLSDKEISLNEEINSIISDFELKIKEIMPHLMQVDISKKKEIDKVKFLVRENFDLYVFYLNKLLSDLDSIKKDNSAPKMNKVFNTLNNFNKISAMPYEKATYLIGNELGQANDNVKDFYKKIKSILEKNKSVFEELELTNKISQLFDDLNKLNLYEKEISSSISFMNSQLEKNKQEIRNYNSNIEKIKSSEQYKTDLEIKESYLKELQKTESALSAIKQKIDFKLLAKHFHFNKKNHELIQAYNSNFKSTLKEDSELKLIEFVLSAQNLDIGELKEIKYSLDNLDKPIITQTDNSLSDLDTKIKELNANSLDFEKEILEAKKKQEKNLARVDKLMEEIKSLSAPLLK